MPLRVGQCEACEAYFLARTLVRGRVEKPLSSVRREQADGGLALAETLFAWFCRDCIQLMRDADSGTPPEAAQPGDVGATTGAPVAKE